MPRRPPLDLCQIDLRNIERALWALNLLERQTIIRRIGILSLWNPMRPDGYLECDLRWREKRALAELLIKLAIVEPGESE